MSYNTPQWHLLRKIHIVGNSGAGKTPLAEYLVEEASRRGYHAVRVSAGGWVRNEYSVEHLTTREEKNNYLSLMALRHLASDPDTAIKWIWSALDSIEPAVLAKTIPIIEGYRNPRDFATFYKPADTFIDIFDDSVPVYKTTEDNVYAKVFASGIEPIRKIVSWFAASGATIGQHVDTHALTRRDDYRAAAQRIIEESFCKQ